MRTAVVSRRMVLADRVAAAAVLIDGERILDIVPPSALGEDVRVHDVGDLVVMPGLVDPHVHVNEPGRTDWEGFATATAAAAAGGVTTLVDMPLNCIPVTTTADALQTKLQACASQLHVDVGFWGGVVPGNAEELPDLARGGVLGCKAFMIDSGIEEFGFATESDLRAAMPVLRELGLPLLAHAELDLGAEVTEPDPRKYASWLQSRPHRWEDEAIALLIELCRQTGCSVHVVHLSSSDAIPRIRQAKAEGLPITVETCAHYLCLSAEEIPDGATTFKCAPPIRDAHNRDKLWEALQEGVIDFVVTDHSPCTPHLKQQEAGDFHQAWGGIASLQLGLPSVWSQARARGIDLPTTSRWLATAPARFAGLHDRKGALAPGLNADLVIWDPDASFEVRPEDLRFKHKVSPYLHRDLRGVVHQTWLRGTKIFERGLPDPTRPLGRPLLGRAAKDSSVS